MNYYLLFKIEQIKKILPRLDDNNFISLVKNTLFENEPIKKIQKKTKRIKIKI